MKKRLGHIVIQFLIVTLAGLGSVNAGSSLCAPDCALCEVTISVSCCDDMSSADHEDTVSIKAVPESSTAGCPHGEICSEINYPVEAGITSSSLFDDFVFHTTAAVFHEPSRISSLNPPVVPLLPPDSSSPPLYTRNCSYLI
jgi:hypothetical protein